MPEQKANQAAYQTSAKEKEQQLQEELDTVMQISRAKDHHISLLEQKLQAKLQQKCSLRGVEVCGETVLEVTGDKPQKLEWPGYGFSLEVPDKSLPPWVTASVAVKAILAGQFQLPEDSQLISAIYWVSASEVFLKEVAVNIQHCAVIRSEEECSKFRFIIAKCSQKELPYKFKVREGVFNPYTQYATIKLKQFSLVGATAPEGTELSYTTLQFYKQSPNTGNVDFRFAVVHNRQPDLEYVRQQWQTSVEDEQNQTICFEEDVITLDLPEDPSPVVVDNWKIVPLTPPRIAKKDVDQFKPKLTIPSCVVELEWTGGKQVQPQRLRHKVTLKGTKSPTYFHIRHDPPDLQAVCAPNPTTQSNKSDKPGVTSSSTPDQTLATRSQLLCDKPSLLQLVNMKRVDGNLLNVIGQIAANYYNFGLNLLQDENGVEVDVIRGDHKGAEAITQAIIKKWLNDGGPTCTYLHLVECLKESGLRALADDISVQVVREEAHESAKKEDRKKAEEGTSGDDHDSSVKTAPGPAVPNPTTQQSTNKSCVTSPIQPSTTRPHPLVSSIVLSEISGVSDWFLLGTFLGLKPHTLATIRHEHPGSCKVVMIDKWLQRMDNVSMNGGPSWQQLADVLESIGHIHRAQKIKKDYC